MRPAQLHHIRPDIMHPMECPCPVCRPTKPRDPAAAMFPRLLYRASALFALGMATGAGLVAATGNLGAALRALVGL